MRNHSSWHVRCTHMSMTKIPTLSENCSTWHTLSPIHILHSTVNVGSTNTFCWQKLDYCTLSLFGGIHGTIVNCYLASASVTNTLPLSSVYQISPDIHCHLPGKSQSSTVGNNGAPTSVPLSLGHALYLDPLYGQICGFIPSTFTYTTKVSNYQKSTTSGDTNSPSTIMQSTWNLKGHKHFDNHMLLFHVLNEMYSAFS